MPTAEKHENNCPVMLAETVKELLLAIVDEREKKVEQRFEGIDRDLADSRQAVKDALVIAKEILATAMQGVADRFDATLEIRRHLESQMMLLATKAEVKFGMDASEKAVLKAEIATDKRFESVNEFRQQLNDQAATFARRAETEISVAAIHRRIDEVSTQLQIAKGKETGFSTAWGVVVIVVTSGIALLALVLKH